MEGFRTVTTAVEESVELWKTDDGKFHGTLAGGSVYVSPFDTLEELDEEVKLIVNLLYLKGVRAHEEERIEQIETCKYGK